MLPNAVPNMKATVSPLNLSRTANQVVIDNITAIKITKATIVTFLRAYSALIASGLPRMATVIASAIS
jgi:hypothetical protein